MRFYLKLLTAIAIFTFGLGLPLRQTITEIADDVRIAYIYRCGSAGDIEKLLDDTQKSLAVQRGETECYEFGKRYQRLLAERLAEAEAVRTPISEQLRRAIEEECRREAFSYTPWAPKAGDAHRTQLASLALEPLGFSTDLD